VTRRATVAALAALVVIPAARASAAETRAPGYPTGTFLTRITVGDLARAGLSPDDAHSETLTFTRDGTWRAVWFQPSVRGQPPEHGRYRLTGDRLRMLGTPDTVRWRYEDGRITFTIVHVPDALARLTYRAHPWRRVS
jgi:hypothetical protein